MSKETGQSVIPTHIGYIVDGNRRWAKKHGVPKYEGHLAGYNAAKDVVVASVDAGVKFVSLYLFSTENWKRETDEVGYLMKLVRRLMKQDLKELIEQGIRLRFLGTTEGLPDELVSDMKKSEEASKDMKRGTLLICFNYGGQREIADAAKAIIKEGIQPEDVTEETITEHLYAPDVPSIDVVVRTSGEYRISNFMLWRISYSEFIFLDKMWPDMNSDDIHDIIEAYNNRQRRFGGS